MVNVRLYKDCGGKLHGFCVSGHAGFARKGNDIVCAAVSILVINTINSINSFTGAKTAVKEDEKLGYIECFFPEIKNDVVDKDADLLVQAMLLGLASLAEEYGDYIRITEEAPND